MPIFDPASLLTRRSASADEGAITRMAQMSRDLIAQGRDIVSLSIGEPDFATPDNIHQAAIAAMQAGFTHYSPNAGMVKLKEAIATKLARENNLNYSAAEIVVTNGAKQALANAILALVEEGDEVIMLAPYWVSYESQIRFAQGTPVVLHSTVAENYKVPVARIAAAITPRSKLLILNSPNNPSGAVWSARELEDIAALVRQHPQLMVLSDEIYEYIAFDQQVVSIASLPGMRERTVTVNGFSKGFAMTGWRLGYSAAPEAITKAMTRIQGIITSGANQFVQMAGIAALEGPRDCVLAMQQRYLQRRDLVVQGLRAIKGLSLADIPATFYALPDVSALLGKRAGNHVLETPEQLCNWLLEMHGVATVPATSFGAPTSIRLSFASSEENLQKALTRLTTGLNSLV